MNQNELKTKIAETLHRTFNMMNESGDLKTERRMRSVGNGDFVGVDVVVADLVDMRAMLDNCAANIAQALPEMLGDETARLRELCKHAHAALMMLNDYKGSPLCDDLKKACGDAE